MLKVYECLNHAPIEVQKARELVDLDAGTESGEVNGVDGLLNQGQVVPYEAGHEDVLLIITTEGALAMMDALRLFFLFNFGFGFSQIVLL